MFYNVTFSRKQSSNSKIEHFQCFLEYSCLWIWDQRDNFFRKLTATKNTRSKLFFMYQESDDEDIFMDSLARASMMSGTNANVSTSKNVARCGICLQWFNDHTTMLTHLQTHSESYTYKSFNCRVCKKTFKEKWQLLRHEVNRLNIPPCNVV